MNMISSMAPALLDPAQGCPAGLRTWNGSDPAVRFGVYRNNVLSSLIAALADTFPVTQAILGEAAFRPLARAYVLDCPPRSPVLVEYGAEFPDFLARHAGADALPCVPDVARLEWLHVEAFHAADAVPLAPEQLASHLGDAERLASARFILHPSLRLLHARHAVSALWGAWQSGDPPESAAHLAPERAEDVLLVRPGLVVEVTPLPPASARFMACLQHDLALGEAANRTLADLPEFEPTLALAQLIRAGALIDVVFQGDS